MTGPTTARFALPLLAAGQAQKELTHNEALALLDAGLHASAEAFGLDTPPAAMESGECWIVGDAPTGVWSGRADALACWTDGGWRFLPPRPGLNVWLRDQQLWAVWTDEGWAVGDALAARLVIGGQTVVAARQPSIARATGGEVIDAEARAALNHVIDRLIAHGLIAS